jgi:hypothetical protein
MLSQDYYIQNLKHNGLLIKYIEIQEEQLCLAALRNIVSSYNFIKNEFLTEKIICAYINEYHGYITIIDKEVEHLYIKLLKTNKISFSHFIAQTEDICIAALDSIYINFADVIHQTEKICKIAVTKDSRNIRHVREQTEEICEIALTLWPECFKYIKNKTKKLCILGVSLNGTNLAYIKDQDEEICLIAIKQDLNVLPYVTEQTEEICYEACYKNADSFPYCLFQSERICKLVLARDGEYIKYIKNVTEELCLIAINQNCNSLRFIENQTEKICLQALDRSPSGNIFLYIKEQTFEICLKAVSIKESLFNFISFPTPELCMEIIKRDPIKIRCIVDQPPKFYLDAHKNGLDISKLNSNDLFEVIKLEPQILKVLPEINSNVYLKLSQELPQYISYVKNFPERFLSKDILHLLLNEENYLGFIIKYLEKYLEFFEISIIDNELITLTDFENKNIFIKDFNTYSNNTILILRHLDIFKRINDDKCIVCLESTMITKKYCSNIHESGMCYNCYKKIMNSDNPTCCFCRKKLLPVF